MMGESLKSRFVAALGTLEQTGNAEDLAALFSEDAEIGNVLAPEKFHGTEGARSFWTKYRATFDKIQSVFSNQIESDDRIALEWTTRASGSGGQEINYEGVSILEVEDGKIKRFRAYFDANSLGRQLETPADKIVSA